MNWVKYFDSAKLLPYPKGVWRIKQDNDVQTPVCILPEPQGGKQNENGRNAYNEANATLIAATPELLQACLEALKFVTPEESAHEVLTNAIKKATL